MALAIGRHPNAAKYPTPTFADRLTCQLRTTCAQHNGRGRPLAEGLLLSGFP
jgi:hypothetical protein